MNDDPKLTARRSGACLEDTYPQLHRVCSGAFSYRDNPNSSPETYRCGCPCHTPTGEHIRQGQQTRAGAR